MHVTFFDHKTETLPPERLRAMQATKLATLVEQTYLHNPLVTSKLDAAGVSPNDVRTLDDLTALPFTTKADLAAAQGIGAVSANCTFPESAYTRFHQTSGTTGEPLRVFDTAESWNWWGDCWATVLGAAGLTATDRLFLPFSFGPFIGFWAALGGAEKLGALVVSGGGRTSVQRLHLMADLGVSAMCCTPTYALHLVEVAREEGFDLAGIPLRLMVLAGEPGGSIPATKARLEAVWGAKCYDHAGASEVGAHSFECQAQAGATHAIDSEFIAEVIEPDGHLPVSPGEAGELVMTNLGRIGFPVIRYRTGDIVCIEETPCPCGRTFTRFSGGIIGRADEMVVVRGVNIYPAAVEGLLLANETVDEFRVTITHPGAMAELHVEIECGNETDNAPTVDRVNSQFADALGLRPTVTAVPRGTLPRFELKARRFFVE